LRVDELTGANVGRYRIGGRLQVLPYASIHRATVLVSGQSVLVWTFREPYATAAGFLETLQHLAGDGRADRVPGLLHVLEIGVQELRSPLVYLATDNAPGGFLVSLLQAGRAPGVFAVAGPLAQTVDRLHSLGLVHGDVQPATVAMSTQGPVLTGHSIRAVVSRVTPQASWVDITRAFRPPEAPSSAEPCLAGDLWGLAALVYYLLVGRPPGVDGQIESPSRLRPQIPSRVDRAMIRALATDPAERFQSGMEFYAALRGLPYGEVSSAAPPPVRWGPAPAPAVPASAPAEPSPPEAPQEVPEAAGPEPEERAQPVSHAPRGWPLEPGTTPASIRAESLPYPHEGDQTGATPTGAGTHLITLEPYGLEPKVRRRGGLVLLSLLMVAVVVVAVLLIVGRIRF
jgi:serine/threonine-protein kinase